MIRHHGVHLMNARLWKPQQDRVTKLRAHPCCAETGAFIPLCICTWSIMPVTEDQFLDTPTGTAPDLVPTACATTNAMSFDHNFRILRSIVPHPQDQEQEIFTDFKVFSLVSSLNNDRYLPNILNAQRFYSPWSLEVMIPVRDITPKTEWLYGPDFRA